MPNESGHPKRRSREAKGDSEAGNGALSMTRMIAPTTIAKQVMNRWRKKTKCHQRELNKLSSGLKDKKASLEELEKIPTGTKKDESTQQTQRALFELFVKAKDDTSVKWENLDELIQEGASIGLQNKRGQTIFHEIARMWPADMAAFLLSKHNEKSMPLIKATDKNGITPMHLAAAYNNNEMIELLHAYGGDVDAKTNEAEGQTPLHYAAKNNAKAAIKTLVKLKADMDSQSDFLSRTPIFLAAEFGHLEATNTLLNLGANVTGKYGRDKLGHHVLYWMVKNTPQVVASALNKFQVTDPVTLKDRFAIEDLLRYPGEKVPEKEGMFDEKTGSDQWTKDSVQDKDDLPGPIALCCCVPREEDGELLRTPLCAMVMHQKLKLLAHPTMQFLIKYRWSKEGRMKNLASWIFQFLYAALWTLQAVYLPYEQRYAYTLPQDAWRIVVLILLMLGALHLTLGELRQVANEYRVGKMNNRKLGQRADQEMSTVPPGTWPWGIEYLKERKELFGGRIDEFSFSDLRVFRQRLQTKLPFYLKDGWNLFDWFSLVMVITCILTHVADAIEHTPYRARIHIRLVSVTLIIVWLRFYKVGRAVHAITKYISMVYYMVVEVGKFICVFMAVYLPYTIVFWVLYGDKKFTDASARNPMCIDPKNSTAGCNVATGDGTLETFDHLMFSVYRIILTDSYDYNHMYAVDPIMVYIVLGSFFLLSVIMCSNLIVSLLGVVVNRVMDNSEALALYHKASLMVEWDLTKARKRRYADLDRLFPPECRRDDEGVLFTQSKYNKEKEEETADLQRVTFKIKSRLDSLMEQWSHYFPDDDYVQQKQRDDDEDKSVVVSPKMLQDKVGAVETKLDNLESRLMRQLNKIQQSLAHGASAVPLFRPRHHVVETSHEGFDMRLSNEASNDENDDEDALP